MVQAKDQTPKPAIVVRWLGNQPYEPVWRAMQRFTESRGPQTDDEIWFTEHPSVFTLGLNANPDHLLSPGDIPVVQIDRGGQVTYHGPGQLMIYPLLDLRRAKLGVRTLVTALEQTAVSVAADYGIEAQSRADAPGAYAAGKKLASVGLRVKGGCSYHGMALNVDVDLRPFKRINTCGFSNLEVTDIARLSTIIDLPTVQRAVQHYLLKHLRFDDRAIKWGDRDGAIAGLAGV